MPVGGSHRGIFKSSGGSSTTDNFDRADGGLGSTQTGDILPWQAISGTWSIASNRPTTGTAASSNPIAVVDSGSPDVDVSLNVSSAGGDALYFRVSDASNWWRMRTDNYTYSYQYSYTCAYTYSYTCYSSSGYTCYATQYCNVYQSSCYSNYASPNCGCTGYHAGSGSFSCYSYSASSCCADTYHGHTVGSCSCYAAHNHAASYVGTVYSYNTACGSYSYTCYQQVANTCYAESFTTCYATAFAQEIQGIMEKAVGGTVTTVGTYSPDPTTFRAVAVGSSITPYVNGTAQTAFSDAAHSGSTKHGFGKGASSNLGTAIDNFSLTDKS